MSRRILLALQAIVAAVVCSAAPARAQLGPNLIAPGDWGSGNATTCPPYVGADRFTAPICLVAFPDFSAPIGDSEFGPIYGPAAPQVTEFTIPTTPGARYQVEFWAAVFAESIGTGTLDALWDGTSLLGGGGTQPFSAVLAATGPTSTLTFTHAFDGQCYEGFCDMEETTAVFWDVRVQQILATPEPATLALVGGGLLLIAASATRRRRT